jgi:hypothetical protein
MWYPVNLKGVMRMRVSIRGGMTPHKKSGPVSRSMAPFSFRRAVSSAVEHLLHTQGVTGSNPVPRTIVLAFRRSH